LYSIAGQIKTKGVILEISSWKGESTFCLAKGLKNGKLFAMDLFNAEGETGSKEIYEGTKGAIPLIQQFKTTMDQHNLLDKIEVLKGYSNQFVDYFKQIDFLFIDGDHSIKGCDFDFQHYSLLICKGGYTAFHDYDPNRKDLGPTWVIENRLMNNQSFKLVYQYDSLWVAKKL
jgi:MMP 1-O-methyltransferase